MKISALNRKLHRAFGGRVTAALADGCIVLRGELDRWDDVVRAGQMAATKYSTCHVVNDITFTGGKDAPMRVPALHDDALDGQTPDVLIIGGGISGVSIARELARQKLDILVVDKECDLALGASGRNDGEVHPGIDLGRGSIKHKYIRRGNAMYDQVCKELDVPFHRVGQYVCFQHGWLRPAVWGYCMWRKYHDGIADTELISGRELLRREPNFNKKTRFAISNPDSGCVCPYGLTIAYAENAVQNGARIALNTAVLGMDVADGQITAVHTNRGTLHPALVINAAGVFAEDVARMADDRFFSIHPRRGTNSILDRKAGAFMHSIASVKGSDMVSKTHSKGGGILHTVHDNLLIGPAPEVIGCFAVAAAALIVFIVRELRCENPLLNLKLLGERNFGVSMAVLAIFGIGMLGGTYLLPLYMQKGLGYTAIMAGSVFLPVGLIQGVLSTCSGFLTRYVKPLFIAVTGILVMTLSFYFASRFTLHTTHAQIMLVLYLRGFGMGLTFAPLNDFSLMNLSQCDMASAAGISNSIKQLSGSVSIALLTVILTGRTAFHSAQGGLSSAESYVAGISDDFLFVTFVSLASALPFLWLLRPRRKAASFKSEGTGT